MVTQKAISLKIDYGILDALDQEAELGYKRRNALINEAVKFYLDAKDTSRRLKLSRESILDSQDVKQLSLRWFVKL